MQAIENKVISRVYGKGKGWAFFKNDFVDLGAAGAIDQCLSRLTKKQRIRRVMRGLYDSPKYSELLGQEFDPDIDQVAHALARKFGWKIQVSGNTALNVLGLSTQVPGRYLYLSDSSSKVYQIGTRELAFKKSRLKDMGVKRDESAILVQALRALNRESLMDSERIKIRNYFGDPLGKKILKDTRYTTSWVYEEIKRIFSEG